MVKLKKIFLIFVCFILIFSIIQIPTSAIAIEVVGGSYVVYAILAAALAAAGYTVLSDQVSVETFEGILNSLGAEDVKTLIEHTEVYGDIYGRIFFNWSSAQWFTFVQWVNSYVSTGVIQIPVNNTISVPSSEFVSSSLSSYVATMIPSSNGIIGYNLGNSLVRTVNSGGYIVIRALAEDNVYFQCGNGGIWNSSYPGSAYVFGSPLIIGTVYPELCIGIGANSGTNSVAHTAGQVNTVWTFQRGQITSVNVDGTNYSLNINNSGALVASNYNRNVQFTMTSAFPDTYTSISAWVSDVINTGTLVGDWRGIGRDVVNPRDNTSDVDVNVDPDYKVGTGIGALPQDIDGSIDIPLDPYIDKSGNVEVGWDVDFTPFPDKAIDTYPDDVVPDVTLNPPRDVTVNPDIPWADDQTFPLDYPTDTTTTDIPSNPTWEEPPNNTDPNENSNRLKLGPLLLSKFPFCLPWDLQHGLKTLVATGSPPVFDIPLKSVSAGINENIHIDLSRFNTVATVSRWFFSALWVVILILLTRKIVWK